MTKKRIPAAAQTVERDFFSLAEIRKMKPLVAPKLHKNKESIK